MLIPNIALIIPQYIMFGKIGWLDSLLPMIVPPMLLYLFGSKYLVGGIKTGGLKG